MPSPTTKNRQALKARFVRGAVPTQTDFSDLIGASLNQAEDGVYKLPHEPLSLVRQKPDQPVLRFYEDPAASGSSWQIVLADNNVPGFGIANSNGARLFIDQATGNLGIGTSEPKQTLHVNGSAAVSKLYADEVWIADKKVTTDDPLAGKITVLANGNVGIGTDNPEHRLSVEGSASISGSLTRSIWCATGTGADGKYKGKLESRVLPIFKHRNDTILRITYSDHFGVKGSSAQGNPTFHWEVYVDGAPLAPQRLRYYLVLANYQNDYMQVCLPLTILGSAFGVSSGKHEIQIWVSSEDTILRAGSVTTGTPYSQWALEAEEVFVAR
jgi:hypothetical protein